MPRKPVTLARAPHDGKWRFSLDLKLWQTVIAILVGIVALYGAGRTALTKIVTGIAVEQAKQDLEKEYRPALGGWKAGVTGQITSLRQPAEHRREAAASWRTVAVVSAAADLATTFIGQRSGAREQNPLLGQQPQRIVAGNAVILGAVWWLSRDLTPGQQRRIWEG